MDWEKIKRIFIVLLLGLNVALFGVNFATNRQYVLTAAEEKAIYKVLSDNGVGLYTDIIKNAEPMRSLSVSISSLDPDKYKELFFEAGEEVKINLAFNKTILSSNEKSLIIEDSNIVFLNPYGTGQMKKFNKESALELSDAFLKKTRDTTTAKVKLENVETFDDRFVFEYNESYKGYKLFSNVKKITVSELGVIMVSASYYTAQNFVGERREIISCDEALLSFLREVQNQEPSNGTYIEKMELGYDFQRSDDVADGSTLRLVPCYRFFVSGEEKAYLVNAYTNEIM